MDFEQHFSNFLALKRATFQDFMSTICQGLLVMEEKENLAAKLTAARTTSTSFFFKK